MKRNRSKETTVLKGKRITRRTKALSHNARQKLSQHLDSEEESETDIYSDTHVEMPSIVRVLLSSQQALFLGLLAFRVVNALLIQTSYVPDEYWQSLEVAHKLTFGYGYLTWEWVEGIRSHIYPLLFAFVYKILALLHLDSRVLLIKSPRLIQAVLAALGDLYLFKLSRRLAGHNAARWSLFCQLTSWFTFYTCTRTLTNSTESVLTTVALYYFPWPHKSRKPHWKLMLCVLVALVVRPTSAIMWLPLGLWYLYLHRNCLWILSKLAAEIGFLVVYGAGMVDRICYGKWVWVQYNFLKFNVFHDIATFYGTHPFHWYLSQGLLVVLGSHCFPFIVGVRKGVEKPILFLIAWTVFVLSCLGHKEFRFLLPILPLIMHVCGCVLSGSFSCDKYPDDDEDDDEAIDDTHCPGDDGANGNTEQSPSEKHAHGSDDRNAQSVTSESRLRWKRIIIVGLIVTNLPVAMYTCLIHQRGVIDVTWFLHEQVTRSLSSPYRTNTSVLFLMPCHSTPFYSYIHQNISMRFLTCEPNLNGTSNYVDEADIFYQNPNEWLNKQQQETLSTHIVFFSSLAEQCSQWLHHHGYQECARFFHTHVPDGRVGTHVLVYCHARWYRESLRQYKQDTVVTLTQKQVRSEVL